MQHTKKQHLQISVVVSGRNTGSKPMNLSAIVGSINSPQNYDMFIQNFTVGVRGICDAAVGAEHFSCCRGAHAAVAGAKSTCCQTLATAHLPTRPRSFTSTPPRSATTPPWHPARRPPSSTSSARTPSWAPPPRATSPSRCTCTTRSRASSSPPPSSTRRSRSQRRPGWWTWTWCGWR